MQEQLKFKMYYGRCYVLLLWTVLDVAGDMWELLDSLTNCETAIAASERAAGRLLPLMVSPPPPLAGATSAPPPTPPVAPPGDLGAALMGRTVLYWPG